jgi:hypothetical protein
MINLSEAKWPLLTKRHEILGIAAQEERGILLVRADHVPKQKIQPHWRLLVIRP